MNFRNADTNEIWKYHAVTAFDFHRLFAAGETGQLEDYLGFARETLHANAIRTFCMWRNTGYSPRAPQYYEKMEAGILYAKEAGFIDHNVWFCDQVDGSSVLLNAAEQEQHWRLMADICRRCGNTLPEGCNEDHKNGRIAARIPADIFADLIATRSSWFEGDHPNTVGSYLSYLTRHTPSRGGPRGEPARRAREANEITRMGVEIDVDGQKIQVPPIRLPFIGGEPGRIVDHMDARQYTDHVILSDKFGAGVCLHGGFSSKVPGMTSDLQGCGVPTGASLEICRKVGEVWAKPLLPPEINETGTYGRGHVDANGRNEPSECLIEHNDRFGGWGEHLDGSTRTFQMIDGNKAYVCIVEPASQYQGPKLAHAGWRIVDRCGPFENQLLVLEL